MTAARSGLVINPAYRHRYGHLVRQDRPQAGDPAGGAAARLLRRAGADRAGLSCCTIRSASTSRPWPCRAGLEMTTSKDVLGGRGQRQRPAPLPAHARLMPAGAPGQLEEELSRNGWLTVQADPEIIFSVPPEERFAAAIRPAGASISPCSRARPEHA
ncbi:YqgE/AlgH family protein [Cupriavidus basilensis]